MEVTNYDYEMEETKMKTITFTKLFTKGNLIGIEHKSDLQFPDKAGCMRWLRGVSENHRKGILDYKIIEWDVIGAQDMTTVEREAKKMNGGI